MFFFRPQTDIMSNNIFVDRPVGGILCEISGLRLYLYTRSPLGTIEVKNTRACDARSTTELLNWCCSLIVKVVVEVDVLFSSFLHIHVVPERNKLLGFVEMIVEQQQVEK